MEIKILREREPFISLPLLRLLLSTIKLILLFHLQALYRKTKQKTMTQPEYYTCPGNFLATSQMGNFEIR